MEENKTPETETANKPKELTIEEKQKPRRKQSEPAKAEEKAAEVAEAAATLSESEEKSIEEKQKPKKAKKARKEKKAKEKKPEKSEAETENVPFHQSRIFIIGTVVDSVVIVAAIIFILFLTHVLCIHSWAEETCTEPKTCSRCGDTEGDPLGHDFLAATCTDPETCSRCGLTQGNALGHTVVEATCTEDGYCSVCGEILEEATGHDWIDATCEEPKTCSICGETEGEVAGHDWIEATCTEPKTCSVCGETEGEAAGHDWVAATCTEPKTCSVCGKTEGEAAGHTWVAATLSAPKTCSVCGKTEGSALSYYDVYASVLKSYEWDSEIDWGNCLNEYWLIDLNHDGVKELLCRCGISTTVAYTEVYTISNGNALHIGDLGCDFSYATDGTSVYSWFAWQGVDIVSKITYSGGSVSSEVYMEAYDLESMEEWEAVYDYFDSLTPITGYDPNKSGCSGLS